MVVRTIVITEHHVKMWKSKNSHCSGACHNCGKPFQVGDIVIQTKGQGSLHSNGINRLHCPSHYYTSPAKEAEGDP